MDYYDNVENLANFIYLFHTQEWVLLPQYPDSIQDSMSSQFAQTNILSRTAPIFSYSYSGPRNVQVDLNLHRDMLREVNINGAGRLKIDVGDDYIETIVKRIQAIALPTYAAASKSITPPMVAVKFGKDIFIKGVVVGGVSIEYQKPIMTDGRYANVTLHFNVYETTPFDAESVSQLGSYRGVTKMFRNGIFADD